ncbi:MAG: [FeFe] hydrogenase H-cluster radical SAM maturase HydG [Candidatus Margulisbacteria bacterium]|nr:[FeFe] hydrogenase H-cluster radical SAM maturase HydG [Candidatus Margulisiibacteriota bacterium]MBU1022049.1 [FeFe] hydrogenase H-cluster radical SAM maturase HydG [Candidatus Margulisiibacteriota bacterium]MBU1729644.1 [FeFe] hydrogenase H-cluster radical SAM maturase HydG [Candidatus Margulisiibacteriota bacterium]MBU1954964.1 [FeFe] hydrogenase H-cluster radical SAM maturase HydG [Candidatus Margulisiibacteriota bacterium]
MINEQRITELLEKCKPDKVRIKDIVQKSIEKRRLSLEETAALLNVKDEATLKELFSAANTVKEEIYGNRLVIFAPLYVSNLCQNECLYCAFRQSNKDIKRAVLSQEEIKKETESILKTGQKRILLVAGETYPKEGLQYIYDSIKTVYSARDGVNNIRRLNVNLAPLSTVEFKNLKKTGIGTYQLFQETYHLETYKNMHPAGPKSDYLNRLSAIDRAFEAGIDDVGIGALFGLYDFRFEILALMMHIEYLEKKFGMGPHTISVPRLEPATNSAVAKNPPFPVSDLEFQQIIAVLRLSVPYTGIILSTRENAAMRRAALSLGVSQISAGSRTNPGGYAEGRNEHDGQFSLGDHRSLDEVIHDICQQGHIPSFCTSCYRLGRTGLDFMELAKPGQIKNKCLPNALLTFKEYLVDYASPKVKEIGEKLIQKEINAIPQAKTKEFTKESLVKIANGKRDIYC